MIPVTCEALSAMAQQREQCRRAGRGGAGEAALDTFHLARCTLRSVGDRAGSAVVLSVERP
jgi:ribosomal protein S14